MGRPCQPPYMYCVAVLICMPRLGKATCQEVDCVTCFDWVFFSFVLLNFQLLMVQFVVWDDGGILLIQWVDCVQPDFVNPFAVDPWSLRDNLLPTFKAIGFSYRLCEIHGFWELAESLYRDPSATWARREGWLCHSVTNPRKCFTLWRSSLPRVVPSWGAVYFSLSPDFVGPCRTEIAKKLDVRLFVAERGSNWNDEQKVSKNKTWPLAGKAHGRRSERGTSVVGLSFPQGRSTMTPSGWSASWGCRKSWCVRSGFQK